MREVHLFGKEFEEQFFACALLHVRILTNIAKTWEAL